MSDLTITTAGVAQTALAGSDGLKGAVIRVTPTIPIGSPTAFTVGDAMTETLVEIPKAVNKRGGVSRLQSVGIFNKDNEDCKINILFFENNSTSAFGTANDAPTMSDANALANNPIGTVVIDTSDQLPCGEFTMGASGADSQATRPLLLQAKEDSTSVYFAIVSSDTAELASTTDITLIFHIEYLD